MFFQNDDQTVYDAASQADIALPYSCKTGRCSSCKCKVLVGESFAKFDEVGLTTEEKAAGWILSCVRTATSDLLIEVEDLGGVIIPPVKTLPAKIGSMEKLAPDVLHISLKLPPTSSFDYLSGQYVDVIGAGGVRRSYSIANWPAADKKLDLHIRAVTGGVMSDYWFNTAKVGDLVRINGPLGSFFLRDVAGLDLVFLATGTGIAPVQAILGDLQQLEAVQRPRSVAVLWGGRFPQDMYIDVKSIPGDHHFVPVLSRPNIGWFGAHGHVQQALLDIEPDLSNSAVYACGSDAMIHSARDILLQKGLPSNRFYSDAFVCSRAN